MNYIIRKIKEDEYKFLDDFIYEAIFIPEGTAPPPKSIINQPELQVYIKNFGKEKDDICFVAEAEGKIVGAVWVRDMADYGHIAEGVPSFAISLFKEYRNFGIGTALMKTMLAELKSRGYERTSLAVQKANYAVKMYKNMGFYIIDENNEEYIMVCDLNTEIVPYEDKFYPQLIEFLEICLLNRAGHWTLTDGIAFTRIFSILSRDFIVCSTAKKSSVQWQFITLAKRIVS